MNLKTHPRRWSRLPQGRYPISFDPNGSWKPLPIFWSAMSGYAKCSNSLGPPASFVLGTQRQKQIIAVPQKIPESLEPCQQSSFTTHRRVSLQIGVLKHPSKWYESLCEILAVLHQNLQICSARVDVGVQ